MARVSAAKRQGKKRLAALKQPSSGGTPPFPLMEFPAEIVELICAFALTSDKPIEVNHLMNVQVKNRTSFNMSLMHTCRRLYLTGFPLYIQSNTWRIDLGMLSRVREQPWMRFDYPENVGRSATFANVTDVELHSAHSFSFGFIKRPLLAIQDAPQRRANLPVRKITLDLRQYASSMSRPSIVVRADDGMVAAILKCGVRVPVHGIWVRHFDEKSIEGVRDEFIRQFERASEMDGEGLAADERRRLGLPASRR